MGRKSMENLSTFARCKRPTPPLTTIQLSKSFRYEHVDDVLICTKCSMEINDIDQLSVEKVTCPHKTPTPTKSKRKSKSPQSNKSTSVKCKKTILPQRSPSPKKSKMDYKIKKITTKKPATLKNCGQTPEYLTVSQVQMKNEKNRLYTFRNWPEDFPVSGKKLAAAGLYSVGSGDCVKCAFCKKRLKNWKEGDDPILEHKRLSPYCPNAVQSSPTHNSDSNSMFSANSTYSEKLSQNLTEKDMTKKTHRLQTFTEWSTSFHVNKEDLANAGFYYMGPADRVKCAYCLRIVKGWCVGDNPLSEHKRLSPFCPFITENDKLSSEELSDSLIVSYSNYDKRLQSFSNVKFDSNEGASKLAQSGFYCTGNNCVRCFSCGLSLETTDCLHDAISTHARLSTRCPFLLRSQSFG